MQSTSSPGKQLIRLSRLIEGGRYADARQLALKLSKKHPQDEGIWYTLAGLHAQQGNYEDVISCCRRVTTLNPEHEGAYYNLAAALQQTGRRSEAVAAYNKCLRINSRNVQTLVHLGKLLSQEGKQVEALKYFERAAKFDSKCSEACYCAGVTQQSLGNMNAAMAAYRNALSIRPDYTQAINNLGHILNELGQLNEAISIFSTLVHLTPKSPKAYNNLGVVYESMGKISEAEEAYRKAIALNPSVMETVSHLGFLLASEGRTKEAIATFDKALKLDACYDQAIAGKAVALEKLGELENASNIVQPSIDNKTNNPDIVLAYCKIELHKRRFDFAIQHAKRLLTVEGIPAKGLADLHFALGDLYDKKGDYAAAFKHYESANHASPCPYDHKRHVRYISSIIKATESATFSRVPSAKEKSRKIIFIVGMPRSGTSLVEQILSSHPDVYGAGELRYIGDIASSFSTTGGDNSVYPSGFENLEQADVEAMADRYSLAVEDIATDARLITDKMPHNFLYLGLISKLFPNARIIHITRNPLDNCLSLYFHAFNPMHSYSTDLTLLGHYYSEYQRLMTHWRNTIDIPLLEIRYEDIVNSQEQSTRQLLDFCDLPWSNRCISFFKNERFVKTPSYSQVRCPIYTSSVSRWKYYSEFITPLKSALDKEYKQQ